MRSHSRMWTPDAGWDHPLAELDLPKSTLALAFWSPQIDPRGALNALTAAQPDVTLVGCSTAGNIVGESVTDTELVVTFLEFEHAQVAAARTHLDEPQDSFVAGLALGMELAHKHTAAPSAVLVISDGLIVNGSDLVAGLVDQLPGVSICGGLAGDGPEFVQTHIALGNEVLQNSVIAVGLWGEDLIVGHGTGGGWEGFGPQRTITASQGSTLVELDGQPALDLYRRYLGEAAADLPSSALLFPLRITSPDGSRSLVRTVLAVDAKDRSMRFAGDVPVGWNAQLMRTTIDRLVDGAHIAATGSQVPAQTGVGNAASGDVLALAVSCVGRRLVLGDRTDEEIEACIDVLGADVLLRGFYSYGEIVPFEGFIGMHNQTMTVTTISERAVPAQRDQASSAEQLPEQTTSAVKT